MMYVMFMNTGNYIQEIENQYYVNLMLVYMQPGQGKHSCTDYAALIMHTQEHCKHPMPI